MKDYEKLLERKNKLKRLVLENTVTEKEFEEYIGVTEKLYPNLMKSKKFRQAVYAGYGV